MDIEEALRWVDRNCTDAATLDRLRSRMVAKTLADEVERLRNLQEKIDDAALLDREFSTEKQTVLKALRKWWDKPGDDVADAMGAAFEAGRQIEREACAKVCEVMANNGHAGGWSIATAIRARSNLNSTTPPVV